MVRPPGMHVSASRGRSTVDLNENGIYLAELTGKALRE